MFGAMTLISAVPLTPPSSLEWKQATIVNVPLRIAWTLTVARACSYGSMLLQTPTRSHARTDNNTVTFYNDILHQLHSVVRYWTLLAVF